MVKVGSMRRANRILLIAGMCALGVNALHASIFRHGRTAKPAVEPPAAAAMSLNAVDVDSSRVLLRTSANPAYTSYSPSADVFVVDLTGTAKAAGITIPATLPPGIASVAAEEVTEMGNRLTRVTFRLSSPAALRASAEGNVVTVSVPALADAVAAVPAAIDMKPAEAPAVAEIKPAETPHIERLVETTRSTESEPVAVSESLPLPKAKILQRVETTGKGQSAEVILAGDGEIAYKAFSLDSPARIVLDLTGVKNTVTRTNIAVADSLVKRIRVSQFASAPAAVTRVVLDLDAKTDYHVTRDGDRIRVSFGRELAAAAAAPERQLDVIPAPAPAASVVIVAEQPAEKVVEKPAEKPAPVAAKPADLVSQVPTIAESTSSWKMPPPAASAGAHAVINAPQDQTTAPSTTKSSSRRARGAAAAPAGENVFSDPPPAAQPGTGTSQTLSGTLTPPGGRTLSGSGRVYTGEPISLNLKDADIKDVLRTFAQLTGLNVAVDPQVVGTVTVDFVDVPWDQALDLILRQNGLTWVLEGNVMRVGTIDRISSETAANRRLAEEERLNVELQTVGFKLSYARATDVQALLKEIASPRARIIVDGRTNQLIISEIPQFLQTMRNLIDSIDVPTRQVVIEARIVETSKSFSQSWGFDWNFNGALDPALGNGTGLIFPNRVGYVGGPFNFGGPSPLLALHLTDVLGSFNLDLALNAAESETLVKVIGAPKVQTQDNTAASIQSGVQIPYQTRVNFTTTINYIDATLQLTVTPQITEAGTVIMDIQVQKTTPGSPIAGAAGTPLNTRQARTRLMVRDGATAVIGGIYQVSDTRSQSRVPILHEIPVLGNLFKDHNLNVTHDELLIFITPRIVRNS
jgi:type IV pilus secretin PilQ/predicted competence protein